MTEALTTTPKTMTDAATSQMDSAWPSAKGGSASSTALRLRLCRPSATANSQPIAGLSPWNTPSPATTSHGQAVCHVMSRPWTVSRRRPRSYG